MKPHLKIKVKTNASKNGYVWIEYTCWTIDQFVDHVYDKKVLEIKIVKL